MKVAAMAHFSRRIAWLVTALTFAGRPGYAEDLVSLPTRSGVTQSFLLAAPAAPSEPRAVAVLYVGGDGKVDLESLRDRFELQRGNFLIRARKHLVEAQVVTALLTVPSDQPDGMSDDFRFGAAHAADARAVVVDLKRRHPGLPIFLIGTSRGTVSAAAVGSVLGAEIAGAVLTATVTQPNKGRRPEPGLSTFDYARLRTRVLVVHHRDDGCYASPYYGARALAERYPLISVSGGAPARSDPCQALSAHGFIGQEAKTMGAIAQWMLGQPHLERIE